jgi:hypothetical protein
VYEVAQASQLSNGCGLAQALGTFVSDGYASGGRRSGTRLSSYDSTSHEQSLARGRTEIEDVAEKLGVRPREDLCNAAARLYKLAVQRNFTRGRRVQQVRACEASSASYFAPRRTGYPHAPGFSPRERTVGRKLASCLEWISSHCSRAEGSMLDEERDTGTCVCSEKTYPTSQRPVSPRRLGRRASSPLCVRDSL